MRAALGIAIMLAVAGAAGLMMSSVAWSGLALVLMLLALNRFFLPSRFEIDDQGITARYPFRTRRMNWAQLRRFVHDAEGGLLSPARRPSRLDSFRGLHVQFGRMGHRAIEAIRERVERETMPQPSEVRS